MKVTTWPPILRWQNFVSLHIARRVEIFIMDSKAWLLLVGINFYPGKENRLKGAVNDVQEIERELKGRYNDNKVIKLVASVTDQDGQSLPPEPLDALPTWHNIMMAMDLILDRASRADTVYIHYSGHGTLKATADSGLVYVEHHGTDAALVLLEPCGNECKVRYLRGIELAIKFDQFVKKGLKLTVVLDACHAGSISRNEDDATRSIPWSHDVDEEFPFRPDLLHHTNSIDDLLRDASSPSAWLLHPRGFALIMACGPHELAKEMRLGDGRHHGALSYFVLEALVFCSNNHIVDITYDLLYSRICAKMYVRFISQHPVLLGGHSNYFAGSGLAMQSPAPDCEVIQILDGSSFLLNIGQTRGVCIGDEYDIRLFEGAQDMLCRATVIEVQSVHSKAIQVSNKSSPKTDQAVKVGCPAFLTTIARPRAYVKLASELYEEFHDILEQSIWLRAVSLDEVKFPGGVCMWLTLSVDGHYIFLDDNGREIPNLPTLPASNSGTTKKIPRLLEHLAKFFFVQQLKNTEMDTALSNSDYSISARTKRNPASTIVADCIQVAHEEAISISFRNRTNQVLYFTTLNLMPERKISKLYPGEKEYQTVLPQDASQILPSSTSKNIKTPGQVRFSCNMKIPRRMLDQGHSHAIDVFVFIISTSPIHGVASMEIPNIYDQMDREDISSDITFGSLVKEGLNHKQDSITTSRDKQAGTKWTYHRITVRTVLNSTPNSA